MTSPDGPRGADRPPAPVRAPDLCRLTVLAERTQVDLAVPADVPVALLVPGIVDLVAEHSHSNGYDRPGEPVRPHRWVLARIGRPPLSTTLTLAEHGIRDGELLLLTGATHTAPTPLFDDIADTVASAGAERVRRWTPDRARLLGAGLAAVVLAIGCLGSVRGAGGTADVIGAVCALFTASALLIGGIVAARWYGDPGSAAALCGCALVPAAAAGSLFVPGRPGAAHLLLATGAAGAVALLALRTTGTGAAGFGAAVSIAGFVAPAAAVVLLTEVPVASVAAMLLAAGLGGLALAPRIAMVAARLPLPAVPAPGTSIDPAEDDPDDRRAIPGIAALNDGAARARRYLTGLIAAAAAVVAGSALTAALAGGLDRSGVALALVAAAVLLFRGRTYTDATQAIPPLIGGGVVLAGLLLGAALGTDRPLPVYAAAVAVAIAALVAGIVAPRHELTPPMRRASELAEYACLAAVLPLVCWVAGLYPLVRGL